MSYKRQEWFAACINIIFVLLTYLFLKQVDEKQTRKFYLLTGLTTIAGALTHYYVIVYAFFCPLLYIKHKTI
ncbi:MAG TPA: hypothetical protein DCS73_12100 [Roseburia sp.]|nr:hypothetical protein [Roseburia sp.]